MKALDVHYAPATVMDDAARSGVSALRPTAIHTKVADTKAADSKAADVKAFDSRRTMQISRCEFHS